MHQFLSEAWIAAAREIRERHADETPPAPTSARINLEITDVPFGDGNVAACLDTSGGALELELGTLDQPDAVVTTDYAIAKAFIVGGDPAMLLQAFFEGRVRIQGDMTKLLALQVAMPTNPQATERAGDVAAELRAITAD